MAGFIGRTGRVYTDKERKAIFGNMGSGSECRASVNVSGYKSNKFALPLVVGAIGAGASLAPAATVGAGGAGLSIPATMAGAGALPAVASGGGFSPQQGIKTAAAIDNKLVYGGLHIAQTAASGVGAAAKPGVLAVGELAGVGFESALSELGEPAVPSVNQLIASGKTGFNLPAFSKEGAYSIDVDKVRDVVQKEYPNADVDTKVTILPPDEYMDRALKDNPGRESEAILSNGFYNPTKDKTFLEAGEKYNTVRALIHELAHDMSDDGVEDYMLNEGYADYVAFKVMTDELGIPVTVARRTLGYPNEVKRVEKLVDTYGRKEVDRAFLKYHSLKYLDRKSPLLAVTA